MEALDSIYKEQLDTIKNGIQESDQLALYLDEEEDEQYKSLIEAFENQIHVLHEQVAIEKPLQLISFEREVLDPEFEGLYLSKLLGYSVLRGRINDDYKYIRPQNHFQDVLNAIINSSNFEQIRQRVGQSVQVGFSLSSDIWVTNYLEGISNKRVLAFFESQKLLKYRELNARRTAIVKYRKQFQSLHFQTADFPSTDVELNILHGELKDFLNYRGRNDFDDSSLTAYINKFVSNESLINNKHFPKLLLIIGLNFDCDQDKFRTAFNTLRASESFGEVFFKILLEHWNEVKEITPDQEKKISALLKTGADDKIEDYYKMLDVVHGLSYIHEDSIQSVRDFYYKHEGLSDENACIRKTILSYYNRLLSNLPLEDYQEYFEINKTITTYIDIFSNQQFNQSVKITNLAYVKKLLKKYIDKRGKDYQDIKKFVQTTFQDLGFMNSKQLVELFKTKRKKKVVA